MLEKKRPFSRDIKGPSYEFFPRYPPGLFPRFPSREAHCRSYSTFFAAGKFPIANTCEIATSFHLWSFLLHFTTAKKLNTNRTFRQLRANSVKTHRPDVQYVNICLHVSQHTHTHIYIFTVRVWMCEGSEVGVKMKQREKEREAIFSLFYCGGYGASRLLYGVI